MIDLKNKLSLKLLFLGFLLAPLFLSCENETEPPLSSYTGPEQTDITITELNKWVWEGMNAYYLWNKQIPQDIDPSLEKDPKELFHKILKEEDRWSFITEDIDALLNSFAGEEKATGASLGVFQFNNSKDFFAVVEYVYPNTPASQAGIKRGDIILQVNGEELKENNYRNLLFGKESYTFTYGQVQSSSEGNMISLSDKKVTVTPQVLKLHPLQKEKIIKKDQHKIGYLHYTQFIPEYDTALVRVSGDFQAAGITDLILDLRYNPGGATSSADLLASLIAPFEATSTKKIFAQYIWNDELMKYYDTLDPEKKTANLKEFLAPYSENLNLQNVYILSGRGTASASEMVINGLKPYMNVQQIGDTTHGKFAASITLTDTHNPPHHSWAMQPIVAKVANANGVTDFKDGLFPDYVILEDLVRDPSPLGDPKEPLLNQAISLITGETMLKRTRLAPQFKHLISGDYGRREPKDIIIINDIKLP